MTPEEREFVRREIEQQIPYVCGEWFRTLIVDVEDHPLEGVELRINWEHPTDGAVICTVHNARYGDPLARFGIQVTVEALPDHDPDCRDVCCREDDWVNAGAVSCLACKGKGCDQCHQVGQWREPDEPITLKDAQETAALAGNVAPRWVPATFLMCLAGDRMRVDGQETDVLRSSSGVWHANNADAWHPTPWKHTELRMDLSANPGFQEYPPQNPCEILMSPERYAVHLLMQTFPGTKIVS